MTFFCRLTRFSDSGGTDIPSQSLWAIEEVTEFSFFSCFLMLTVKMNYLISVSSIQNLKH